jgi:hypothetical protein
MNPRKKQLELPEPELSPSASRVSLDTLSLAGAGLPDDLERQAERSGLEVDRFTGEAMVRSDELGDLVGDRSSEIRETLNDPGLLTETEAAAAMSIGPEVVRGLAARRGVPTMVGADGEVLVHRRLWENLCRLLSEERREFDGEFRDERLDWLIRHRSVTEALSRASDFQWDDPFYKPDVIKPRVLRAFESAMQAVTGPPRPAHLPTTRYDEDQRYRAIADRIGVRHSTTIGAKIRGGSTAFLGWDLQRLCGLVPVARAAACNENTRIEAYERLTRDSYLCCFPTAIDPAALRAELEAQLRRPELAHV